MKRRQEAAEEAERQRLQAEQEARAAAEAQAEASRLAEAKDSHDAPGSPQREQGKIYTLLNSLVSTVTVRYLPTYLPMCMYQYCVLDTCKKDNVNRQFPR